MIYIKAYGPERGPAFICLHGWGGDHREFAPLAARLPDGIRLLCPDLPGYGQSIVPEIWSCEAVADSLVARFVESLKEPCTMVGYCSGAALAVLIAQRHPEFARRVIMIDPFAFVPWYFKIFLAGWLGRQAYMTTFDSTIGQGIANRILRRMQHSRENFTQTFNRVDHDVVLRYLAMFDRVKARSIQLPPTLGIDLISGSGTFAAVHRSIDLFASLWPQARRHRLDGVGHLPFVRAGTPLARIIFNELSAEIH